MHFLCHLIWPRWFNFLVHGCLNLTWFCFSISYALCVQLKKKQKTKNNDEKGKKKYPILVFWSMYPSVLYSNFLLPHSDWNGSFCIFHAGLLSIIWACYAWSYYNWSNAVIIDLLRSGNNILKKHVLTIIIFYIFMCDDLFFINNTTQKTSKPS